MRARFGLRGRVGAWFAGRFPKGFSRVQKEALPHTLAGRNTLILAPTGSGKTLAAFLSVLARLEAMEKLPNAVCAVYVSPLRSLTRDIERNLQPPLNAVNAGRRQPVRIEVRTGDTEMAARSRMQRQRPHLLLTTPESLSALLSQTGWRDGFAPFAVIVDEIHSFAESKRGSLLALTLERLELHAPEGRLQRIGVSATASPVETVARLLCGARPCEVASDLVRKTHKLELATFPRDLMLPAAGYNPYRIATRVAGLVQKANTTLCFTFARSGAERLGLALKYLLPQWEEQIAVHHSSIDREERLAIEAGLSDGRMKAVVCSSSLELGVDFAAVDQVLLVGSPRGVSQGLQRLGRAGHRVDGVAKGAIIALSLPDLLQGIAMRRAAGEGWLDPLSLVEAPLDVLAQVLLGLAVERPWRLDEAYALVRRAGPYRDLARAEFDEVIEYLAGGGRVLSGPGGFGKIILEGECFRVASRKVAQQYYFNIGTISDDFLVSVNLRGRKRLGSVEESFLSILQPGEAFLLGGQAVRLKTLHQTQAIVEPASGERIKPVRWMGNPMSLTAGLAAEELTLRRGLRAAADPESYLRREWQADRSTARRIAEYVARQRRASNIPVDAPVQLERVPEKRAMLLFFHIVAGRNVNRALAWVVAHRMREWHSGDGGSIVANFDDYGFLLSIDARKEPPADALRAFFDPERFLDDLRWVLRQTEQLGRRFRPIAETAQLLARRNLKGPTAKRSASWNGSLLYETLMKYEPDHPLVRETIREIMEQNLDAARAEREAARIHATPWETYTLPRPSPFTLPIYTAFNRETLVAQDPDRALDELARALYDEWKDDDSSK